GLGLLAQTLVLLAQRAGSFNAGILQRARNIFGVVAHAGKFGTRGAGAVSARLAQPACGFLRLFAHALVLFGREAGPFGSRVGEHAGDVLRLAARARDLLVDRAQAFRARFRDNAGHVAGTSRGRVERLVEQPGEALEPLLEVAAAMIERGEQRIELRAPLVDALLGLLVAALDELGRLGEFEPVLVELAGELAEIGQHLAGDLAEAADVVLHPARHVAGRDGDLVHRADEFGHTEHQRVLKRAHALVRAGQHFLQLADGATRGFLRLRDGLLRAALQRGQGALDRIGRVLAGGVYRARDLVAVGGDRAAEGETLLLERCGRAVGGACDLLAELQALLADRVDEVDALFRQDRFELLRAPSDFVRDAVGLADKAAGDVFAGVELDRVAELFHARVEQVGRRARAQLDLIGHFFRAADQQFFEPAVADV